MAFKNLTYAGDITIHTSHCGIYSVDKGCGLPREWGLISH
jgi:hypothetical protein